MKPARTRRGSWFWVQGAVAGGVVVALPGVALLLGVLLCPAALFYALEKVDGHPVGRAMILCGITMAVQPLRLLWNHGGTVGAALDLLADPGCPLLAWVACSAGWLLCEAAQIVARLATQTNTRRQIQALERERTGLQTEWDAPETP